MEFKKRLKTRLFVSLIIGALGIAMMICGFFTKNSFPSSFGFTFLVICIAKIRQYFRITKNEETLRKREIAETDERNIMLWTQARSLAVSMYMILCAVAIIVLNIINLTLYADVVAYNLIAFVALYWISYFITLKRF